MLDNQLDADFISLDLRQQQNREQIAVIVDETAHTGLSSLPGTSPEDTSNKNQVNGYAGLDSSGKVPPALINLTNSVNKLASDVALTSANTFYDGPNVSLAPGKWLIIAHLTFGRSVAAACALTGRISDGSTHYASGEITAPNLAHYQTLTLTTIITLVSTTTIKAQGACTSTDASLLAAANDNPSGNNSSQICAVRIA